MAAVGSGRRTEKSAAAFRTISEVAEELDVQQHVLRFWETKFGQVRPLKRGGGRRYYRPEDVRLLKRIRALLYDDGYTIKGVQRLLREGGVKPETAATVKRLHTRPPETPPLANGSSGTTAADPAPPATTETATAETAAADERPASEDNRAELKRILAELEDLRALLLNRSA